MQQRSSLACRGRSGVSCARVVHAPGLACVMKGGHGLRQQVATALLLGPDMLANSWLQRDLCCRTNCLGVAADAAAVPDSTAGQTPQQQPQLPPCQPHDIIRAVAADGSELFLEVVPALPHAQSVAGPTSDSSPASQQQQQQHELVQLAHQGVIYTVDMSSTSNTLHLQPQAWQLNREHPLVKALPGWSKALQLQQSKQTLPQQPLQLQSAEVVYSAAQLQAAVQQNPALWRDGTGPMDPPLKGLQYQTLCAGEIECLLNRSRGVVMVQLSVGWDATAPQPVSNLLVLHSLERALGNKHIRINMSSAPGGLGLTAILSGKAEPYRSWAAHLASFGAQAALIADSPYYKLLIGRVLGYKEENIRYHIQSTSGRQHPSAEVIAAVDKDLAKLSKKRPDLPWKPDAGANTSKGRGAGRQQQQSSSAKARR